MPSNPIQPGSDGQPYNLAANTGQTILLHNGIKVILKAKVTKPVRYFTSHLSFVGTDTQVEAKIKELKLI